MLQEERASEPRGVRIRGRDALCTLLLAALALGSVSADIWTKRWALTRGAEGHSILRHFLTFELTTNTGASFGLFAHKAPLLAIVGGVVLIAILVFWWIEGRGSVWLSVGVGLLAGGALGNLIDRVRLGWVVDFLRFDIPSLRWWPAFNVADVSAVVGVLIIVVWLSWPRRHREAF